MKIERNELSTSLLLLSRMEGVVRPALPWEKGDGDDSFDGKETPFGDAHDLMMAVLNHQMFTFNENVLKRIAVDSVVSCSLLIHRLYGIADTLFRMTKLRFRPSSSP